MANMLIKEGDLIKYVELNEVLFFTKKDDKVIAVLVNKVIQINCSLYYINEIIGGNGNFIRSHKSFIINTSKIDCISKYTNRSYNVKFRDCNNEAFITTKSLKSLSKKFLVI